MANTVTEAAKAIRRKGQLIRDELIRDVIAFNRMGFSNVFVSVFNLGFINMRLLYLTRCCHLKYASN